MWKGERAAYVVAREVVDLGLREHGVVCQGCMLAHVLRNTISYPGDLTFEFTLAQWWCVASDENELCLARAKLLERRLVSHGH